MLRPLIQKSIVELQEYFELIKNDKKELKKLADELTHRNVPKAISLAKLVQKELHNGTLRPLIQKSIVELQEYFELIKNDKKELKKLADELTHRNVPKAISLAKLVQMEIKHFKDKDNSKNSSQAKADEKIIVCQNCNQKLRIILEPIIREFSCPKCKIGFRVSFDGGVFSIIFLNNGNREDNVEREHDRNITVVEAYKLFEADEFTTWEVIELNRRRLIQQYHPDKVFTLGPKLKIFAEMEVKRINIAFDKLKKHRGI